MMYWIHRLMQKWCDGNQRSRHQRLDNGHRRGVHIMTILVGHRHWGYWGHVANGSHVSERGYVGDRGYVGHRSHDVRRSLQDMMH